MIAFALKLTRAPAECGEADVAGLRAVGLTDRAIHDLVNCTAYFAYANRITHGLGVRVGGREGVPGQ